MIDYNDKDITQASPNAVFISYNRVFISRDERLSFPKNYIRECLRGHNFFGNEGVRRGKSKELR